MDSMKNLQAIRMAMLASVVFCGLIATLAPSNEEPKPIVFYGLSGMAIVEVAAIFVIRRILVSAPRTAAVPQPQQANASMKPETALILIYCLSEAVALYGLVLHFLGFSWTQVLPFFIAGLVLLFFFDPRRIVGGTTR
jgi:hypothetical protein